MKNNKLIVLSLGGSIIIPREGFDIGFLKNFKKLILKFVNKGYRFVIVCGGGQTARAYQAIARKVNPRLTKDEIDWIGIQGIGLNAFLLKNIFKGKTQEEIVENPTKKIVWKSPILIAGGWKPGFSTDFDAVKLAKLHGVKKIFNLSNISYVYDKDPKKFKDAKKLKAINWKDFCRIMGNKWVPGMNLPFDPVASKEAQKNNLTLYCVRGTDLKEVEKAIKGEKFQGTIIT